MNNIYHIADRIFNQDAYNFEAYEESVRKYTNEIQEILSKNNEKAIYLEKIDKERKEQRHFSFLISIMLLEYFKDDDDLLCCSCRLALSINFYKYIISKLSVLKLSINDENKLYIDVLTILAKAYRNAGKFEEALQCYKDAQAFYSKTGDKLNESWMTYSIGKMYLNYLQQPSRSISILQEARADFESLTTNLKHRGISACIDELGDVYRQGLKDYPRAIGIYNEAVIYNSQEGRLYPSGLSRNYSHIGLCYWQLGDLHQAEAFFKKAIDILRSISGQEKGLGIRLTQLGKIQIDNKSYDLGYSNLLQAQEFNERYLNTEYIIFNLIYQGDYYYESNQINEALSTYLKSISKSKDTLFYELTSIAFNKASNCYFKLHLFNESRQALIESINSKIKYWDNMRNGIPNSQISLNPEIGEMYQSLFYKLGDVYATDLTNTVSSLDRVYDALILGYEQQKKNYENVLRFGSIMNGIKHEIQNLHNDIVVVIKEIIEEKTLSSHNLQHLVTLHHRIFEKSNVLYNNNLKEIIANIDKPFKLTRLILENIFAKIASDFRMNGISFEFSVSEMNCSISIDEVSLKYVLLNVLLNSIEAFETFNKKDNKVISVKSYTTIDKLIFIVNDNAGGIPDNIINKVFDFGFTTKAGNTGYGLSSVRTLINSSNGEIILENNKTNGTEVIIKFSII